MWFILCFLLSLICSLFALKAHLSHTERQAPGALASSIISLILGTIFSYAAVFLYLEKS